MTEQIGNGVLPLRIGNLINTLVYGGPYRECPEYMFGIRMAAEFPHLKADMIVPTKDFSVPEVSVLKAGVVRALMAMISGQSVYVGCKGGWGRTGIFLAALAKVQIEYRKTKHRKGGAQNPVKYVRAYYSSSAVETEEQEQFIKNLDVSEIVAWIDYTQNAVGLGGVTPPTEGEVNLQHSDYTIVEQEEDWLDAPEPDSADIEISKGDVQAALFMSLQIQIDELREEAEENLGSIKLLTAATRKGFKAAQYNFDLANLTLGQRIINWWHR